MATSPKDIDNTTDTAAAAAVHNIELIRAHANSILSLADRFYTSARVEETLDTIEHHTRQIDALIKTTQARITSGLLINILVDS